MIIILSQFDQFDFSFFPGSFCWWMKFWQPCVNFWRRFMESFWFGPMKEDLFCSREVVLIIIINTNEEPLANDDNFSWNDVLHPDWSRGDVVALTPLKMLWQLGFLSTDLLSEVGSWTGHLKKVRSGLWWLFETGDVWISS